MIRPVQYFSKEYLEQCKKMKPEDILRFLEDFRTLHFKNKPVKSKLISIKVPENLLRAFKTKARLSNTPYQSQIKKLMRQWV
ncbi:CopG family antitoxin [Elusimicrobiota bacterium]